MAVKRHMMLKVNAARLQSPKIPQNLLPSLPNYIKIHNTLRLAHLENVDAQFVSEARTGVNGADLGAQLPHPQHNLAEIYGYLAPDMDAKLRKVAPLRRTANSMLRTICLRQATQMLVKFTGDHLSICANLQTVFWTCRCPWIA